MPSPAPNQHARARARRRDACSSAAQWRSASAFSLEAPLVAEAPPKVTSPSASTAETVEKSAGCSSSAEMPTVLSASTSSPYLAEERGTRSVAS